MKNEALHRKQFTFYDSYLNAVLTLPKCRRFEVLLGIVGYGLQGREPDLTGPSRSVFEAVRPSLDAGRSAVPTRTFIVSRFSAIPTGRTVTLQEADSPVAVSASSAVVPGRRALTRPAPSTAAMPGSSVR